MDAVFILLERKLSIWLKPRHGPAREIARLNAGEIVGRCPSWPPGRPSPQTNAGGIDDFCDFKLMADQGFAARFYRALAIYLSATVREHHPALVVVALWSRVKDRMKRSMRWTSTCSTAFIWRGSGLTGW